MGHHAVASPVAGATDVRAQRAQSGAKPLSRNEIVVLDELRAAGTPLKAYALLERVEDQGLRAPMTVYRALDSLIARRLVRRIASLNAFAAVNADESDGAIVICRRCGQVRTVGLSQATLAALLAPAGMNVAEVFIEAHADCVQPGCR
jgi:Fur family zinc uptake transcriptional regulator